MKRIVMMVGGVETLEYFSKEMGAEFARRGYPVFFYDLKDEMHSTKKLRKFLKPHETVLVTFNFEGLEKEAGVYKEGTGYLWDAYQIPCYNIAVDHPYYYHDRLKELPKDYHHISIDRCQEQYFKTFYPEFHHQGFLPLAGSVLHGEGVPLPEDRTFQDDGTTGDSTPSCNDDAESSYAQRPMDVIFTGNYTELEFFEPYINWINDEYAAFYRGIIEELIRCPWKTVEEVAIAHCEREMGKNTTEDLRGAFHKMIFIDMYVRNYWRGLAVKTLVDAQITVDVVGKGWEKLECLHPECLRIHPQTDSAVCLAMIKQAKISLNVMPWFKDGAHDRVFNSIANGTVCVTDGSRYLCEQLQEGDGVCYYELLRMEELPKIVAGLLENPDRMQSLVAQGQNKVLEQHLWKHRADTLLQWVEE
jgi:hypothetical protein